MFRLFRFFFLTSLFRTAESGNTRRRYVDERKVSDQAESVLIVLRLVVPVLITLGVACWWVLSRIPPEELSGESRLVALTRMFLG